MALVKFKSQVGEVYVNTTAIVFLKKEKHSAGYTVELVMLDGAYFVSLVYAAEAEVDAVIATMIAATATTGTTMTSADFGHDPNKVTLLTNLSKFGLDEPFGTIL